MKIGILTLTLHTNYGGILQAYALQTVLERMGHEVEVFNRPFTAQKTKWKEIPKRIIKKMLGMDVVVFKERRYNREAPIINKAIWDFRKKYIHERIINSLHEIQEGDYDCIVVGSDQVWRPKYFKSQWKTGIEDAYLAFTKGWNIKRITYAASFGGDEWEYTPQETRKCAEAAKLFENISLREDSSVRMLAERIHQKAVFTIDPTFLLKREDYCSFFHDDTENGNKDNLLVYFLDVNQAKMQLASSISKEKKLNIISNNNRLSKKNSPIHKRILPSVEDWIGGFFKANFVITDSFHACVFSIIFNKPFVAVLNSKRGAARFDNLKRILGKSDNFISDVNEYQARKDYSLLIQEPYFSDIRNKSLKYICQNLK